MRRIDRFRKATGSLFRDRRSQLGPDAGRRPRFANEAAAEEHRRARRAVLCHRGELRPLLLG